MRSVIIFSLSIGMLLVQGCLKERAKVAPVERIDTQSGSADQQELKTRITSALEVGNYEYVKDLLHKYISTYPDDAKLPSFRLMLADVYYELEQYAAAYETYNAYHQYYPSSKHAEYALYKAAHAQFAQSNDVACDATPVEKTIELCNDYLAKGEYQEYRAQIKELLHTCQQRLLNKEFLIAKAYMAQNRLASAKNRLKYISDTFDLAEHNGQDKLLFYNAKLARQEDNTELMNGIVSELHELYPDSRFTAMAQRVATDSETIFDS